MSDQLTEFLFPERGVRGAIVEFTSGLGDMLGWRAYSPAVRRVLTHAMAAMPLLASHTKFEGRINLQFQGKRTVKLLVAQIDRTLRVRGMAKADPGADAPFAELFAGGTLALLLEPEKGAQSYQAFVEIRGASLGEALEAYFQQSEQLPTLLRLAADGDRIAGILLQRMPAHAGADHDADWHHLSTLFGTLAEPELATTEPQTLLRRLFHEEDLRVFESRPVQLACSCSHASISAMLIGLGEKELEPVLQEQGKVEVTCEFCGRQYEFVEAELQALFSAATRLPGNPTRH